jgi:hypothetical protein
VVAQPDCGKAFAGRRKRYRRVNWLHERSGPRPRPILTLGKSVMGDPHTGLRTSLDAFDHESEVRYPEL